MIHPNFALSFRSRVTAAALALCSLLFIAGCGDGGTGPGDVSVADLAGSWILTTWEYRKDSNPQIGEDLVVIDGLNGRLIIQTDGSFTFTRNAPEQPGSIETGTLQISGGLLTFNDAAEGPITYSFELVGNNILTLSTDDVEWMFEGDNNPSAASLLIELERLS